MHELEIVDGKAMMAYAGEVPWHGLGNPVSDKLTAREMMEAAGLDWEVLEKPTFAEIRNDKGHMIKRVPTGMKALIRSTDYQFLDQVGMEWNPVQNHTAFEFFTEFLVDKSMQMHTAGSLKQGRLVWALAKINDDFELANGDKVEGFLLFTNPHIYGKVVDIRFTPIRVVCNNTLTFALKSQANNVAKFNHSHEFDPEEAKRVLGLAHDQMGKYEKIAQLLSQTRYSNERMREYFGEIFGASKDDSRKLSPTGEQAVRWIEKQPGAEMNPGTWWNAFNTVTFMTDHILGRKADTRLESAWYGINQRKKQIALEKAMEYAAD